MTSSGSYGYYTYYIEGILKNVSGKKLNYAQVSFVIYDMDGNNIGSAFNISSYNKQIKFYFLHTKKLNKTCDLVQLNFKQFLIRV